MINLKNLIDFLPYEYKDNDTYKVDNKGILERFLEICGDHFESDISKDIDNILDLIDIDKTPEQYLNYLWEFLGQMPFAYGNTINPEVWENYYNGFYSDDKLKELSKLWIIPKDGPYNLPVEKVRTVLKYSIALFKIRGTSKFFEIMFMMYGLECTVEDPSKVDTYDGWLLSHPYFDYDHLIYDDDKTYDNIFNCSQCIPVKFKLRGHGYTSNNEAFKKFREATEIFFDRFKPYNVKVVIDYGFQVDDGYSITASFLDPNIKTLIISEVFEVPLVVNVTSNWKNADLRYEISGDKVTWGYTKHNSGSIFKINKPGTYYFRSVGDKSKITEITVNQVFFNKVYNIYCTVISDKITANKPEVETQVIANLTYKGNVKLVQVRLSGTDIVKNSGATWKFTEAGTYTFEVVGFPVKQTTFVVTKDPETYGVICTPPQIRIKDGQSLKDAITQLTVLSNYQTDKPLYCKLIGDNRLYKSGDTFQANAYGIYKFKCTLDKRETDEGVGIFEVITDKTVVYRISVNPVSSVLFGGKAKTLVKLTKVSSFGDDNFKVTVLETGEVFDAKDGHTYTVSAAGNYTFKSQAYPSATAVWSVTNPPEFSNNQLSIVPVDKTDSNWLLPNWSLPEDQINDTYAKYRLADENSSCKFSIQGIKNGLGLVGNIYCKKRGTEGEKEYTFGEQIIINEAGIYDFTYSEDTSLVCTLEVLDFETLIQVTCNPTHGVLKGSIRQVSTEVSCISNKQNFDNRIKLVGTITTFETPHIFTTSNPGVYIFESIEDPSQRASFTVSDEDLLKVEPEVIIWESDETDEREIIINTYNSTTWKILKS